MIQSEKTSNPLKNSYRCIVPVGRKSNILLLDDEYAGWMNHDGYKKLLHSVIRQ